jgi:hypothetical protein
MEKNVLRTYKFYDAEGRRLAIFGKLLDANSLEIYALTCSKHDQFSKKFAAKAYDSYFSFVEATIGRPDVVTIPISANDLPMDKFIHWCETVYFKRKEVEMLQPKVIFTKVNEHQKTK